MRRWCWHAPTLSVNRASLHGAPNSDDDDDDNDHGRFILLTNACGPQARTQLDLSHVPGCPEPQSRRRVGAHRASRCPRPQLPPHPVSCPYSPHQLIPKPCLSSSLPSPRKVSFFFFLFSFYCFTFIYLFLENGAGEGGRVAPPPQGDAGGRAASARLGRLPRRRAQCAVCRRSAQSWPPAGPTFWRPPRRPLLR